MTRNQAIERAQELAFSRNLSNADAKTKHIELKELFEEFDLTWIEIEG